MNCLKNLILKGITGINIVSMMLMLCMVDSDSYLPLIVLMVNMVWLFLFFMSNIDHVERFIEDYK